MCDGLTRITTPTEYYEQPAIYTAAVGMINDEERQITAERAEDKHDGN